MQAFISGALALLVLAASPATGQSVPAYRFVIDTVHSRALMGNRYGDSPDRRVLVYLPASYDSSPSRRYPVVYLLHGYSGNERDFVRAFPSPEATDSLIRAGGLREMIVVTPSARNALGGSFYLNSATTGNWEDFIVGELIPFIDAKYRTLARPASRGLAGVSMGGYGTFVLGMRHAGDVYGALYAMSACCTAPLEVTSPGTLDTLAMVRSLAVAQRMPFGYQVLLAIAAAFSPDTAASPLFLDIPFVNHDGRVESVPSTASRWAAVSPHEMVPRYAARLKQLRGLAFDIGRSDELVPPATIMAMDTALTRAGVPHAFELFDGGHVNRLTQRFQTRVLPFFSRTLDFTP